MQLSHLIDLFRCPKCKEKQDIEKCAHMIVAVCRTCNKTTKIEDQWSRLDD
jgi:hypothetical protein